MAVEDEFAPINGDVFATLKHDIKNQLSNIQLALEGLRYELPEEEGDYTLYMESMVQAAQKIDQLLDNTN